MNVRPSTGAVPFKTLAEVEFVLMEWTDWYNNARLHSRLDYPTPAEYYPQHTARRPALILKPEPVSNP